MHDGFLYESSGQYGQSAIIKLAFPSGEVVSGHRLPDHYFAEGLAHIDERFVQLTWKAETALVYDANLNPMHTLRYKGEGWGLTRFVSGDGPAKLMLSDGSDQLRIVEPDTLETIRSITVSLAGEPVPLLNELEQVGSQVLANIWHSDRVVVIEPTSGEVTGWFDFSALRQRLSWPAGHMPRETDLNGLALHGDHLLVTGKYWPKLFEVEMGSCKIAERHP